MAEYAGITFGERGSDGRGHGCLRRGRLGGRGVRRGAGRCAERGGGARRVQVQVPGDGCRAAIRLTRRVGARQYVARQHVGGQVSRGQR